MFCCLTILPMIRCLVALAAPPAYDRQRQPERFVQDQLHRNAEVFAMAKSSFSLLAFSLTVLTLLLGSGSPALANSISNNVNNLVSTDSTVTLFGVESNGSI